MKRLAVIIPYEEKYIDDFTDHFKATIRESKDLYYKLVFMKQKSNRPLNKGKLFNIVYMLHKEKFDYFCFHDSDLIPISGDCDYSYTDKPISLVAKRNKIEFGDQEKVQNFNDYTLPYDEYFGGAILFNTKDFEKINGYSNEYWGFGYEDYDLLFRCTKKGLSVKEELGMTNIKYCGRFNGVNSYGQIIPMNNKLKNLTNRSFTMTAWICPDGEPPYSDEVDNNKCEYFIFGRPGYHMGLSYTHGNFLKAVLWVKSKSVNREAIVAKVKVDTELRYKDSFNKKPDKWFHIGMVVNDRNQVLTLYVNGKKVEEQYYEGELVNYLNKPYYIGVGNPNTDNKTDFFAGDIAQVSIFDKSFGEDEIKDYYKTDYPNSLGNDPKLYYDFSKSKDGIVYDLSGNGNHGIMSGGYMRSEPVDKIPNTTLPHRNRPGRYKSLSHPRNDIVGNRFVHQKDTSVNEKRFVEEIQGGLINTDEDGLTDLNYSVVGKRTLFGTKHEMIDFRCEQEIPSHVEF